MNPNPNPANPPEPLPLDPGEEENIKSVFRNLFTQMEQLMARQNLANGERLRQQSDVMKQIFDYVIAQKAFMSKYPGMRRQVRQKAGEMRDEGMAPQDLKDKAMEVIGFLDNLEAQPGVRRGGRRKRRSTRKTRKGRKGTRRH